MSVVLKRDTSSATISDVVVPVSMLESDMFIRNHRRPAALLTPIFQVLKYCVEETSISELPPR